jgi:pilus assembly protein CpaC
MRSTSILSRASLGTALIAMIATTPMGIVIAPAAAAAAASTSPSESVTLSVGRGQLVRLSSGISDVFVADDKIADVQVRSPTQIYIFGKGAGETTIYATAKGGGVVYAATVRVGQNLNSIQTMLKLAMPDAAIEATPMNGLVLLTGTVRTPDDVSEASRLVQAFVGKDTQVVSRLKTATPLQVNLHVKIAEVSRDLVKQVGVNLLSRDTTGGFLFGIAQGRNIGTIGDTDLTKLPTLDASSVFGLPTGSIKLPFDPTSGQFIAKAGTLFDLKNLGVSGKTAIGAAGRVFGLDLAAAIDLSETDGLVTTLAEPNLTALSGETASFLAGGEIPIPLLQGTGNSVSVEFKSYGVSLAFTPIVLDGGRISLRVRPEVSEITSKGAVQLNGFTIPALTTRRAETTVELGSGQSVMIGGLMSNNQNNSTDKAPFLGDLPILGSLFRSNNFRRNESELVIIVTPYLVKPSSAPLALPTDGYKAPTDFERIVQGKTFSGKSGKQRPVPTSAAPITSGPSTGALMPDAPSAAAAPPAKSKRKPDDTAASANPGFSLN